AQPPPDILRLAVIAAAVTLHRVFAEDRGDLDGVGEIVGAAAPGHGFVHEAQDVETLVIDAGAVHFEQRDASGVATDRRPYRKTLRVRRHRYLLDHRAEAGETPRRLAHPHIDVRLGIMETKT